LQQYILLEEEPAERAAELGTLTGMQQITLLYGLVVTVELAEARAALLHFKI
jgi:predicted O-methyltransferase YrrM